MMINITVDNHNNNNHWYIQQVKWGKHSFLKKLKVTLKGLLIVAVGSIQNIYLPMIIEIQQCQKLLLLISVQ